MSSPDDFKPSGIFKKNWHEDFHDVYDWSKVKILQFLEKVAAKPEDYGVTDAKVKEHLKKLQGYISGLANWEDKTKKSLYWEPKPAQQTLRVNGSTVKPSEEISWTVNSDTERFYLIFDLLGAFLSLISSVPDSKEATAKNYFLPLAVLYSKWCCELGFSKNNRPSVAQVTWCKQGTRLYPFFGASVAGCIAQSADSAKRTRWGYLKTSGLIVLTSYPEFDDSPDREEENRGSKAGTRYGNCGETYPFLYILKDKGLIHGSFGIAVNLAGMFNNHDHYVNYKGGELWKLGPMVPPCINCKSLLYQSGLRPVDPKDKYSKYPNYELYA